MSNKTSSRGKRNSLKHSNQSSHTASSFNQASNYQDNDSSPKNNRHNTKSSHGDHSDKSITENKSPHTTATIGSNGDMSPNPIKNGLFLNDRVTQFLTCCIGSSTTMTVKNGAQYRGFLRTFSQSSEFALSHAHRLVPPYSERVGYDYAAGDNPSHTTNDIENLPTMDHIHDDVLFGPSEFVSADFSAVDLNDFVFIDETELDVPVVEKEGKGKKKKPRQSASDQTQFRTDEDISAELTRSRKVPKPEKELVAWKPDKGDVDDPEDPKYRFDANDAGWNYDDCIKSNKQKGYKSNYNDDMAEYSNADISRRNETDAELKAREKRAADIAKQIESSGNNQAALKHELDENIDDETKFAAVQRKKPNSPPWKKDKSYVDPKVEVTATPSPTTPREVPIRNETPPQSIDRNHRDPRSRDGSLRGSNLRDDNRDIKYKRDDNRRNYGRGPGNIRSQQPPPPHDPNRHTRFPGNNDRYVPNDKNNRPDSQQRNFNPNIQHIAPVPSPPIKSLGPSYAGALSNSVNNTRRQPTPTNTGPPNGRHTGQPQKNPPMDQEVAKTLADQKKNLEQFSNDFVLMAQPNNSKGLLPTPKPAPPTQTPGRNTSSPKRPQAAHAVAKDIHELGTSFNDVQNDGINHDNSQYPGHPPMTPQVLPQVIPMQNGGVPLVQQVPQQQIPHGSKLRTTSQSSEATKMKSSLSATAAVFNPSAAVFKPRTDSTTSIAPIETHVPQQAIPQVVNAPTPVQPIIYPNNPEPPMPLNVLPAQQVPINTNNILVGPPNNRILPQNMINPAVIHPQPPMTNPNAAAPLPTFGGNYFEHLSPDLQQSIITELARKRANQNEIDSRKIKQPDIPQQQENLNYGNNRISSPHNHRQNSRDATNSVQHSRQTSMQDARQLSRPGSTKIDYHPNPEPRVQDPIASHVYTNPDVHMIPQQPTLPPHAMPPHRTMPNHVAQPLQPPSTPVIGNSAQFPYFMNNNIQYIGNPSIIPSMQNPQQFSGANMHPVNANNQVTQVNPNGMYNMQLPPQARNDFSIAAQNVIRRQHQILPQPHIPVTSTGGHIGHQMLPNIPQQIMPNQLQLINSNQHGMAPNQQQTQVVYQFAPGMAQQGVHPSQRMVQTNGIPQQMQQFQQQ